MNLQFLGNVPLTPEEEALYAAMSPEHRRMALAARSQGLAAEAASNLARQRGREQEQAQAMAMQAAANQAAYDVAVLEAARAMQTDEPAPSMVMPTLLAIGAAYLLAKG